MVCDLRSVIIVIIVFKFSLIFDCMDFSLIEVVRLFLGINIINVIFIVLYMVFSCKKKL